ncbi:MAG: 2-methoxy-6-polyprenyl-1,4-benzoquinol methylase, mitochondrial [Chlamydiia bacterium]|nr:2-methoxy-6-polyprenyl-1,4-benzoquinol methylase, mitochondrial [Chlamydiia bacterium]MCH9615683.1 2-methoxy-6-polyprenyl-1,4-benzoquinol methylase, mitochondrial [Chlamydiia bacterium]MCH9628914.1 2-methoxy-6-polyprenyl-1,4-benzoquinol methylase, mitochondrial [Chlamydiia bacterium]
MTSWKNSSKWYNDLVSKEGHYYHRQVILPRLLKMLKLKKESRLLDLACGQGVLSRVVECDYLGIDAARPLIKKAKEQSKDRRFKVHDLTKPIELKESFSHAVIMLALQNISDPLAVLKTAAKHLEPGGMLVIILNHPCFRIPRQTHWGWDEKCQYRRIDAYMSDMEIPIKMHPGKKESDTTMSFHTPLSKLTKLFSKAGFVIELMDEWISDKKSEGGRAKIEDKARREIPLFLACKLRKLHLS